jgi:Sec-independent protein translocase protein TatA
MFGVGPQELVIVGLLLLVVFGPSKCASIARDMGRLVNGAQRTVEDFKSELISDEVEEARRTLADVKSELVASGEGAERRRGYTQ